VIDVGGKTFTTFEKIPTNIKWSVSVHSGATFPTGKREKGPGEKNVLNLSI